MVLGHLQERRQQQGVRPFDPARDLKAVAALMAVAFGDRLDPAGQVTLAQMNRMARTGLLLGWYYWLTLDYSGAGSGFVWVEDGRVVGNVSLRRVAAEPAYLVGNVAVHPDWRRRGIATALMRAALETTIGQGAQWVGLEVRADNAEARRLYERLGFGEIGRTLTMLRPAGPSGQRPVVSTDLPLRRARAREASDLLTLARESIPVAQHPFFELRRESYRLDLERRLRQALEGRREVWWVAPGGTGLIHGAVRALSERRGIPHRLEVLVGPEYAERLGAALVWQGLSSLRQLSRRPVEATVPNSSKEVIAGLEAAGFDPSYSLVQMRQNLRGRSRHGVRADSYLT